MKKGLTEMVFILDRSGSMSGLEADTIGGFNAMIEKQKREEGEALVSTLLFDSGVSMLHDRLDIGKVPPMTEKDYSVRGCTALLDAVGSAIRHIAGIHKYSRPEDVPEHTVFVITTDGTVTDIPRQDYQEAEERVIRELQEIGKPFVVLLNSSDPTGERACAISTEISGKYNVKCIPVNCLTLDETAITALMRSLLFEFPLQELDLYLPSWVEALPLEHPIKSSVYQTVREEARQLTRIRELDGALEGMRGCDSIQGTVIRSVDLGTGVAQAELQLPRSLFYDTLSQRSGLTVTDDGDLMELLTELGKARQEYDKVAAALKSARENGYGIVMPSVEELDLEDPEIVKQGGRYGVRMKASAPSIHMIRADIETTVSPIVGNEKQSEDMVNYLLQEFEGDTSKIWNSNIFGRSFHEIVGEDLQAKLKRMPAEAQVKLRQALERIINEGGGGLICIIL